MAVHYSESSSAPIKKKPGSIGAATAVYGGRIISAFVQAIALVLLAREVLPSELGVITVAIAIISAAGTVADLGIENSASRALASGDLNLLPPHIRHHALVFTGLSLIVVLSIMCARYFVPQTIPFAFYLLGVWIWLERRSSLRISLTVASQRALRASFAMASSKLAALVFFYVALNLFDIKTDLLYFLFLNLSAAIAILLSPRLPRKNGINTPTDGTRAILKRARPFWMASLSGQARSMDTVVLGALAGPTAVGMYAFPARAIGPLRLFATSMGTIAMPSAAKEDWEQVNVLERAMWVLTCGFVAGTLVFGLVGQEILTFILGEAYAGSAAILAILMLGVAANIPGATWSAILQGSGKAKIVANIGLGLVPVYYVSVVGGISINGAVGAAWGVTGTFVVQLLIMAFYRLRKDWPGKNG